MFVGHGLIGTMGREGKGGGAIFIFQKDPRNPLV